MAIVLAAASMPARASGLAAAAANSRVWIAMPVGAMAIIGWMAGTTWLTLPMSEEPRRSGIGVALGQPDRPHVGREEIEHDAAADVIGS